MTLRDAINKVKDSLQLGDANKYGLFKDAQIVNIMNLVISDYIEEQIEMIRESRPGFRANDQAIQNLRTLLLSNRRIPAITPTESGLDRNLYRENVQYGILPQNLLYLNSSSSNVSSVKNNNCSTGRLYAKPNTYNEYIAVLPFNDNSVEQCIRQSNLRIRFKNKWDGLNFNTDFLAFDVTNFRSILESNDENNLNRLVDLITTRLNRNLSTAEWTDTYFGSTHNGNYRIESYDSVPSSGVEIYWERYKDIRVNNAFILVTTDPRQVLASTEFVVSDANIANNNIEIDGLNFTGISSPITEADIRINGVALSTISPSNTTITNTKITIQGSKLLSLQQAQSEPGDWKITISKGVRSQELSFYRVTDTTKIGIIDKPLGIESTWDGIFVQLETGGSEPTFSGATNSKSYTLNDSETNGGSRGRFQRFSFSRTGEGRGVMVSKRQSHNDLITQDNIEYRINSSSTIDRPKASRPLSTISNGNLLMVYSEGFRLTEFIINYYKKPEPLSLEYSSSIELPDIVHREIVRRTVEYARESIKDPSARTKEREIIKNET